MLIRMRRVGQRRSWPFFQTRPAYEIVIAEGSHEIFNGTTTTPSPVLVSRGKVHTTDSYDWIAAADQAASQGEAWVTDPFGGR
ncbi:hypothetical protein [Cellulomonas xylanilytica]|uniref:Uncharacterized protein n=1 Tax=Cellulomonas xylanilytica TaxID=233583 RepID=A0A510V6K8_9CELL|nr:hypothetical protein [Cellulomonas xylanilytica]GEK22492.1 hypothetical protein CXY01_30120 [Cellulomonas xylanilytica]